MALTERLQFLLTLNGDQAVTALRKVGDTADRELGRAESSGDKLTAGFVKYGAGAVAFATVAGAALYGLANAGSDLAETMSASQVIFGDSAKVVEAFGETAAEAAGLSKTAAIDAANTFGTFGRAAGLAGDDLAAFSVQMVQLAGDFASFKNTSPQEAVEAIGAAMRGESEPIRKYGILLDDATLKHRALELGIYGGTGALTGQQRVLAAQAEILAQSSLAQGDFERTSGSLANQQRILTAEFENLKAKIGTKLIPVFQEMIGWLIKGAGYMEGFGDTIQLAEDDLDGFVGRVGTGFRRIGDALNPFNDAADGIKGELADVLNSTNEMATGFGTVDFAKMETGFGHVSDAASTMATGFGGVDAGFETMETSARSLATGFGGVDAGFEEMETSGAKAATALVSTALQADILAEAQEGAAHAAHEHVDDLNRLADALNESGDAAIDAADDQIAMTDAQKNAIDVGKDQEASIDDVRDANIDAAKATADYMTSLAASRGETRTATQKLDDLNSALIDQASQLKGPQRDAVLGYIGNLNGIPPEKVSEISAQLDSGSVDEAKNTLTNASAPRTAYVSAEALTAQAARDLDALTRPRTVTIRANQVVEGARAGGGPVKGGRTYLVGEEGPELFTPPGGGNIVPNDELTSNGGTLLDTATGTASGVTNITVNVTAPFGTNPDTFARAVGDGIARRQRQNGPGR